MERVWQETKTPFLVYATEKAIHTEPDPLSHALETFVKADNKSFRQELNQEQVEATTQDVWAGTVEPKSPSKRKHRADSIDSIATNRASVGSNNDSGFDDPFEGEDEEEGTRPKRTQTDYGAMDLDGVDEAPPLPKRNPAPTEEQAGTSPTPEMQEKQRDQLTLRHEFLTTPNGTEKSKAADPFDMEMQNQG